MARIRLVCASEHHRGDRTVSLHDPQDDDIVLRVTCLRCHLLEREMRGDPDIPPRYPRVDNPG